jgi:hypothetical protein
MLHLVKPKSKKGFYLLKILKGPRGSLKGDSFILKTLPYIYNLAKALSAKNISNGALNYAFVLRYLYRFGANFIKNF